MARKKKLSKKDMKTRNCIYVKLPLSHLKKVDHDAKKYHITRREMLKIIVNSYIRQNVGKTKTGGKTKQLQV